MRNAALSLKPPEEHHSMMTSSLFSHNWAYQDRWALPYAEFKDVGLVLGGADTKVHAFLVGPI